MLGFYTSLQVVRERTVFTAHCLVPNTSEALRKRWLNEGALMTADDTLCPNVQQVSPTQRCCQGAAFCFLFFTHHLMGNLFHPLGGIVTSKPMAPISWPHLSSGPRSVSNCSVDNSSWVSHRYM